LICSARIVALFKARSFVFWNTFLSTGVWSLDH
jgi:hypothetical protein